MTLTGGIRTFVCKGESCFVRALPGLFVTFPLGCTVVRTRTIGIGDRNKSSGGEMQHQTLCRHNFSSRTKSGTSGCDRELGISNTKQAANFAFNTVANLSSLDQPLI